MSRKPKKSKRAAKAPALETAPAPLPPFKRPVRADLVPDPDSYRRWIDARTERVFSAERSRWMPVEAMYADYDAWLAHAEPGLPPLSQLVFETELRADQRHQFDVLDVRPDLSMPEPDYKECLNRRLRPAIPVRRAA